LGHVLPIDALHPLRDIFDEALGVTVLAAAFMPVFPLEKRAFCVRCPIDSRQCAVIAHNTMTRSPPLKRLHRELSDRPNRFRQTDALGDVV